MMKAKVFPLSPAPGQRMLAVSDIHGNPDFLNKVLELADFTPDDLLFVVGDVLEKGEKSLETLRCLMDLSRGGNVFTLNGNCDDLVTGFVDGREELDDAFYDFYLHAWGERCTLVQMGREAGLSDADMADYLRFAAVLRERFQPELDFLRGLPTIIDTPEAVFVHGGVPSTDHMEELEAWRCMKNDDFLHQDARLDKWCVVGHWPVTLYHPHIPRADPLVDREKKIVSIDGGCSLKLDGQLNLLEMTAGRPGEFSWVSWDGLPTVAALDGQAPSADSINIRWGRNAVEVLSPGPELSRCRHPESGRELDVLTAYLYRDKRGVLRCQDSTDYRLAVSPGDVLSVVRRVKGGILAKKDGVTGWYFGRVADA